MSWMDVAAQDDLFEGASIAVTPNGHDIALHGAGRLCEGFLEGHEIE